ncbi:uncharacterized protein LOC119296098 [Triticum dicoccoides]|uniref:uncharacterized protein LOC119296098 n=1 Tax=Triticum dicoccoides TaxID=85692 RepID=UPI00188EA073|nr:uncharacterized protein LOC119296098 [Triticum dicoccoides]
MGSTTGAGSQEGWPRKKATTCEWQRSSLWPSPCLLHSAWCSRLDGWRGRQLRPRTQLGELCGGLDQILSLSPCGLLPSALYLSVRFLLAVGSSSEHRGSGRSRLRSTAARGLVLPPPEQSEGGRCRVKEGHERGSCRTGSARHPAREDFSSSCVGVHPSLPPCSSSRSMKLERAVEETEA